MAVAALFARFCWQNHPLCHHFGQWFYMILPGKSHVPKVDDSLPLVFQSQLFVCSYWWLKNSVNIKQQQQQQVVIIDLIKLPWWYIYIYYNYIYIFIVIRGIIIIVIIIIYIYSLTIVAVISHGFHVSSVTSSGSISSGRTALASVPMDMSGARCIPKVRSTCGISTIYGCRMRIIYTYHHLPIYIL